MVCSTGILRIPSIRSIEDFLGKDGWKIPKFDPREFDQLQNHLITNLIYYQANYGALLFMFLSIISFFRPIALLINFVVVALLLIGFAYSTQQSLDSDRTILYDRPITILVLLLTTAFMIIRIIDTVSVFLLSIVFPAGLIIIHAAVRSPSSSNVLLNEREFYGFQMTPMGLLLGCLGAKSYEE